MVRLLKLGDRMSFITISFVLLLHNQVLFLFHYLFKIYRVNIRYHSLNAFIIDFKQDQVSIKDN